MAAKKRIRAKSARSVLEQSNEVKPQELRRRGADAKVARAKRPAALGLGEARRDSVEAPPNGTKRREPKLPPSVGEKLRTRSGRR